MYGSGPCSRCPLCRQDDWIEWNRRLSVELLRESPSPALRSCSILAQSYYPLARELFNPAFISCWGELYETFQGMYGRSPVVARSLFFSTHVLNWLARPNFY
jgi:phosphatidylinositol kinase/protein kinase (PI-3  family)